MAVRSASDSVKAGMPLSGRPLRRSGPILSPRTSLADERRARQVGAALAARGVAAVTEAALRGKARAPGLDLLARIALRRRRLAPAAPTPDSPARAPARRRRAARARERRDEHERRQSERTAQSRRTSIICAAPRGASRAASVGASMGLAVSGPTRGRRRLKRIGMGLVGAGFVGPHHVDAVRRLGYVDIVAVAGSNDASGQAKADALGARRGYGSYQALHRRSGRAGRPQRDAEPSALRGHVGRARQGQARRVGQAAGDDGRRVEAAGRRSAARRRRHRRHLQLPRQSARAAGASRHRPRRHRHAALRPRPLPAGLAAEGHRLLLASRPGEGRRLVGARRHRLALVRPGAARHRPAHHARARRPHHRGQAAQEAARLARGVPGRRRRRRGRRGHPRSRIWRRCWCGSTTARAASSRSARCAAGTRTISCSRCAARRRRCDGGRSTRTSCGSAIATARTRCCRRTRRCSTRKREATRTCPAAIRRRGPTRSAT